MIIRHKSTGKEIEVLEGSPIPPNFEKVDTAKKDDEIKVGEPVVEYEIEEMPEPVEEKPKKAKKSAKKGKGKKNGR